MDVGKLGSLILRQSGLGRACRWIREYRKDVFNVGNSIKLLIPSLWPSGNRNLQFCMILSLCFTPLFAVADLVILIVERIVNIVTPYQLGSITRYLENPSRTPGTLESILTTAEIRCHPVLKEVIIYLILRGVQA